MNNVKRFKKNCAPVGTQTDLCEENDCGLISYNKDDDEYTMKCLYCNTTFPILNSLDFVNHIQQRHQFFLQTKSTIKNKENCKALEINDPIAIEIFDSEDEEDEEVMKVEIDDQENEEINKEWMDEEDEFEFVENSVKQEIFEAEEEFLQETQTFKLMEPLVEISATKTKTPVVIEYAAEKYFPMKDILLLTNQGRTFLLDYETKRYLDAKDRKFLMHEVANFYIKHDMILNSTISQLLVTDIVSLFPTERKELYYYQDNKGHARVKMYDTYNYKLKKARTPKKTEDYFSVQQILTFSIGGQHFLANYKSKGLLDVNDRKFLINLIVNYYVERDTRLTEILSRLLVTEIVSIFPTECKDAYNNLDSKGCPKSKIYDAYHRRLSQSRKMEDCKIKINTFKAEKQKN